VNNKEQKEPVDLKQLQRLWDDRYDDDISLIDLWIDLTRFRNVFLVTFILVFLLGAVFLGVWHKERYSLSSMLQIGSVQVNDEIVPLESPEALSGKLVNVIVPKASAVWSKQRAADSKFHTDVELIEGSDVVMIKNQTTVQDIEFFTNFQKHLVDQVIQEHFSKASVYQSGTRSALNTAQLRLEFLQNKQALDGRLKLIDEEIALERSNIEALKQVYPSSPDGSPMSPVAVARGEDKAQGYNASIRELELRKVELNNEHSQELAQQKSIVHDLERALKDINHTRVISEPVLSLEPVNMSMAKLLVMLLLGAAVIATLATLLALFNDKVKTRRAELAV
jgi:hypothetical protein